MKNTANKNKLTVIVSVLGLVALGVVSFLLSDTSKKFYEPNSEAVGYCTTYGTFPKYSCTNLQCPTGRYCATKLLTGATATFCLSRTATSDQMMSCCAAGYIINTAGSACVLPPTPTPTQHFCDYGSNPKGTCSNTSCDIGGSGLDCRTEWVANALRRKCLSASTTDMIKDCCGASSSVKGSAGAYYCQANATPTPTPTKINCQTYGVWSLNACSNPTCSTASIQRCVPQLVSGASEVKCANRTDGVDEIRDCCAAGKILNSAKTACVTVATTTVPATTVPATTVPVTSIPPTTQPLTATPSVTTSITTTPPTGSVTGTATPTLTATPTSTLPPTTSPTTNRTPSVTHTPSETGFSEDILIYLGGAFYVIGVLAFVFARYLGVSIKLIDKRV